jgi:hypothetical protein
MLGVDIDIGRSQVVGPTHEIRAFTLYGLEKKVGWLIEKLDQLETARALRGNRRIIG